MVHTDLADPARNSLLALDRGEFSDKPGAVRLEPAIDMRQAENQISFQGAHILTGSHALEVPFGVQFTPAALAIATSTSSEVPIDQETIEFEQSRKVPRVIRKDPAHVKTQGLKSADGCDVVGCAFVDRYDAGFRLNSLKSRHAADCAASDLKVETLRIKLEIDSLHREILFELRQDFVHGPDADGEGVFDFVSFIESRSG